MATAELAAGRARGEARAADAMLLTCVVLWSGNFTAIRYGLERFGPLAQSEIRFALAGSLFALFAWRREGSLRIARRDWGAVVLLAFVGIAVNQVAVAYAVRDAGAANVAMLMASAPIFAAGLAVALGHERPGWMHWAGIGVSVCGVYLVVSGSGATLGGAALRGILLGVLTAASWGVYSTLVQPLMPRYSATRLSGVVIPLGSLMLLPLAAPQLAHQDWAAPGTGRWLALGYSIVFALLVTNVLWFEGIRRVGAPRATLFMYLQPFLGAVIALLLLGERVSPEQWLGGATIIAGVVCARLRPAPIAPE